MKLRILNLEITFVFSITTTNKKRQREIHRYRKNVKALETWHRDFDMSCKRYCKKGLSEDTAYVRAKYAADNQLSYFRF